MKLVKSYGYLLLIDEGAEINEPCYVVMENSIHPLYLDGNISKKSQLLDKVWKLVIAYRKLNEEDKELDLPELPPFEDVDIEKIALDWFVKADKQDIIFDLGWIKIFEAGYKAAQSNKQFTLEDMKKAIEMAREMDCSNYDYYGYCKKTYTEEEIIQSLSTQQLPKEFIMKKEPIYEEKYVSEMSAYMPYCIGEKPWIITNSEGKEELVGTYKY